MSATNGSSHGARFANKVATVTGGSSGMGREASIALSKEGAKVVVADMRPDALRNNFEDEATASKQTADLIKSQGGEATFVKTDLGNLDEIEALVAKTVEVYGRVDILMNFAGINPSSEYIINTSEKLFDLIYKVNVKGCYFMMQHVLRQMLKQEVGSNGSRGKIVNVASINGLTGGPMIAAYDGSKHAVIGLTKSAACEHAKDRINVNAICPGIVNTSMTLEYIKDPAVAAHFKDKTRWPRGGHPADQAKMALFLASDDAEFITGSTHLVDGGLLAGY